MISKQLLTKNKIKKRKQMQTKTIWKLHCEQIKEVENQEDNKQT